MIKNPQFELAKSSKLLKYLREVEKNKIKINFLKIFQDKRYQF